MIIVKIQGGLGNQMSGYAFYLKLSTIHKNVKLDKITHYAVHRYRNGYELDKIFNVKENIASINEIEKLSKYKNVRLIIVIKHIENVMNKLLNILKLVGHGAKSNTAAVLKSDGTKKNGRIFAKQSIKTIFKKICYENKSTHFSEKNKFYPKYLTNTNIYYDGHWLNIDYYEDILDIVCKHFTLKKPLRGKNKNIIELISSNNICSASIHVRRTDYVNTDYDCVSIEYYKRAVLLLEEQLKCDIVYLVFSDDIDWVKENLNFIDCRKHHYIDWNKGKKSYIDMYLMSKCNHNIIANSTFSWWGSLLNRNENKIIVSPKHYDKHDIIALKYPKNVKYFEVDNGEIYNENNSN